MTSKWIFNILVGWIAALLLITLIKPDLVWGLNYRELRIGACVAAGIPLLLLWALYIKLLHPISVVNNGMDLLKAQDFGSRLVAVGQRDADSLVDIFNSMMDHLKEERLRNIEQNNFLQLLIQASPMGIAILDFDGRITLANPSMLALLQQDEAGVKGRRLSDFEGEVANAIAGTPQGQTRTLRFSDTNIVRISRLNFLESGFLRPYVIVESLTKDVMKAEKEAYGKVIRLIAHEVNNTMGGVNSILETLSLIMENEPDLTEAIESCRERCTSLSEFITSYADVVRIPPAKLSRLDLNSRIERMMPFLEGLAGPQIRVTFTPSDKKELFVNADTVLIEQVMVNIVKNSKESILSGAGTGTISIKISDKAPHIEIADNGKGISRETAEKLFSPFFSTKRGGQGIGLMMVGDILRQHGCRFSLRTDPVSPENPDSRPLTRFKIEFPKA